MDAVYACGMWIMVIDIWYLVCAVLYVVCGTLNMYGYMHMYGVRSFNNLFKVSEFT